MDREFLIRVRVPGLGDPSIELLELDAPRGPLPLSVAGPACPIHLRELVRHAPGVSYGKRFPASWRCAVFGCPTPPQWDEAKPRKARR